MLGVQVSQFVSRDSEGVRRQTFEVTCLADHAAEREGGSSR
jgi:hypothetical protein